MDDEFINLKCPHCGKYTDFPQLEIGQIQECPFCSDLFLVSDQGDGVASPLPLPHQTARLRLRKLEEHDTFDAAELLTDWEAARDGSRPGVLENPQEWLDDRMESKLTQPDGLLYLAIEVIELERLIGIASIRYADRWFGVQMKRSVEIDVNIHSAYQQQGCGTEALTGLLQLCFRGLNFRKVVSNFDNRNEAWHRTLTKVCFRKEGVLKENWLINGEWVDTASYAILEREFRAKIA